MMRAERGGIVLGWLVKLLVGMAIVGVTLFEAGAIIVTRVTADRIANDAAGEAGLEYGAHHSTAKAERVAEDVAARNDAELIGRFEVNTDLDRIRLTIRKQAKTLFIHRIGPLRRFIEVTATGSGPIR